ncbi:hypothetical protein BB560_002603 [Smittium megazygosporum]|uniref:Uncharacterized protein n=1 Tax=Smittium megazygosporum TaxID=133381 RepID=A0A2T9ZEF4_9FUNG|nr:hypothetical protein BB560_002603 [Smittium megazygosporum]
MKNIQVGNRAKEAQRPHLLPQRYKGNGTDVFTFDLSTKLFETAALTKQCSSKTKLTMLYWHIACDAKRTIRPLMKLAQKEKVSAEYQFQARVTTLSLVYRNNKSIYSNKAARDAEALLKKIYSFVGMDELPGLEPRTKNPETRTCRNTSDIKEYIELPTIELLDTRHNLPLTGKPKADYSSINKNPLATKENHPENEFVYVLPTLTKNDYTQTYNTLKSTLKFETTGLAYEHSTSNTLKEPSKSKINYKINTSTSNSQKIKKELAVETSYDEYIYIHINCEKPSEYIKYNYDYNHDSDNSTFISTSSAERVGIID